MEEGGSATWSDLMPDLLGLVITRLPFPGDRARFRAVCRSWHSAARQHVRQLPWIVFPSCSFCTIGDDGVFFPRIPGLPGNNNATCLGAASDAWLALDCTDDVLRRTSAWFQIVYNINKPSEAIRHRHNYLLHNPFSGETVPLPELDSIFGHVPETFQIHKVLMRSSSNPRDVVAVVTNNWKYNLLLLCRGKGKWIPHYCLGIFDVAFLGDSLYAINLEEELITFDLGEDHDGMLTVDRYRRVIKKPLANGEADLSSWMYDEDEDLEDDEDDDDQEEEDSFNNQLYVPTGKETTPYEDNKGHIVTTRRLITSHDGTELLMVRHHMQVPPCSDSYTLKVQVFKADINMGNWVSVTTCGALGKGEALFPSQCFSMSTRANGDINEGFIYFLETDDVFDTNSWACAPFSLPREKKLETQDLLTWLLPPELVV